MTWVKLSDGALRDPRLTRLPRGPRLLYLELLAWRNENLLELDGELVPIHVLRWLSDEPDLEEAVSAIVAAGGMVREGDAWRLVWFVDDQPARDEVAGQRHLARERQERHRRHLQDDHSKCDPDRCRALLAKAKSGSRAPSAVTRDVTRDKRVTNGSSDPTRPVPSRKRGRGGEDGARSTSRSASGGRARGPAPDEAEALRAELRALPRQRLLMRLRAAIPRHYSHAQREVLIGFIRPALGADSPFTDEQQAVIAKRWGIDDHRQPYQGMAS